MRTLLLRAIPALVISGIAWASSTGAPAGSAGVPNEGNCTDCHGGAANSGQGNIRLELIDAASYQPGQRARLRITLADPTAARWGFSLTARTSANTNNPSGALAIADAANTRLINGEGGIQYVTHTSAGTRRGTSGSSTWEVDWTGPAAGGAVTFFVAGNAANNDGQSTGDRIYTSTLQLSAVPATTTTKVLPQFVFGGGYYTAIYLHNTTMGPTSVNLKFFANDGSPLNVPSLGGATVTANIAGGGTSLLEAPNSGGLQSGWAQIDLPDGVIGYGVFRQIIAGRADQEAVVPFSSSSASKSTLIFDDTSGLKTAIAIANPTSNGVAAATKANASNGGELGITNIGLLSHAKTAANLETILPAVARQRGSVEFNVANGAASVLGLRFGGEAFTSVPAFESIPEEGTTRILPQFAFGGGYYTGIYLYNNGSSSAMANVQFFSNDGTPLNVTALGGTTAMASIPAKGVALLEAPNVGSLQQGWARILLPEGVSGYGVFRQSVPGRADQEAVVPFAGAQRTRGILIFDDAGLTTTVALANPSDGPITVMATAKGTGGAVLGTSTITLPARNKTAFLLRSNIGAVANQRGSVEFAASGGSVSVLGLRFGGEAFTSVPAAER